MGGVGNERVIHVHGRMETHHAIQKTECSHAVAITQGVPCSQAGTCTTHIGGPYDGASPVPHQQVI